MIEYYYIIINKNYFSKYYFLEILLLTMSDILDVRLMYLVVDYFSTD